MYSKIGKIIRQVLDRKISINFYIRFFFAEIKLNPNLKKEIWAQSGIIWLFQVWLPGKSRIMTILSHIESRRLRKKLRILVSNIILIGLAPAKTKNSWFTRMHHFYWITVQELKFQVNRVGIGIMTIIRAIVALTRPFSSEQNRLITGQHHSSKSRGHMTASNLRILQQLTSLPITITPNKFQHFRKTPWWTIAFKMVWWGEVTHERSWLSVGPQQGRIKKVGLYCRNEDR